MTTRLIQIAATLLLLGATGLAGAAEALPPATTTANVPAAAEAPAPGQPDRISWQRVGAPEETVG